MGSATKPTPLPTDAGLDLQFKANQDENPGSTCLRVQETLEEVLLLI